MANQNPATQTPGSLTANLDGTSPHFLVGSPAPSSEKFAPSSKSVPSADLESQLIDQTKHQIRALAQEIAELVKSNCEPEEFYSGFLTRMTTALASIGGAVWQREEADQPLELKYHINLKQSVLATDKQAQHQHSALLNRLLLAGEATIVPPHSGASKPDEAGNPTGSLLVVAPLKVSGQTVGLVEIFQRPNAGPTTQNGYVRFVAQMAELASDYLTNQRLRSFTQAEVLWQQLQVFTRTIHQGLDTKQIAYTIANEGRRITEVDRLSVALGAGRACKVEAVSGLDSIERRADQIKRLGTLAASVIQTGEPLWYEGDDSKLPPQIERKLHEYIDRSHGKTLAIIPLKQPPTNLQGDLANRRIRSEGKPLGAIIIEQLKESQWHSTLRPRIEIVAQHSEIALTNALEHNSIFLLPVWKAIGQFTSLFQGSRLGKSLAVIGLLAALGIFLCCFPYSWGLSAAGSLTPDKQYEVFAQEDGVLEKVLVSDTGDSIVEQGQILAEMYNNDLQVEIENLLGEIQKKRELLRSKEAMQTRKIDPLDAQQIDGEINTLRQEIINIGHECDLRKHQQSFLQVRSPAKGQVINWQARQNLLRRPVRKGQHLMTIVDPDTDWQIELRIPERRVAHLIRAMRESDEPLTVTFGLMSQPGTEYVGKLLFIDNQLDVHADDGNTALVRVGFDNKIVARDLLRSGTRVTAKFDCGKRAIGYVFFHELIETIRAKMILWF
jgi:hypothetical protein